jgi:2-haloalkanoic acid dehalogenase type II
VEKPVNAFSLYSLGITNCDTQYKNAAIFDLQFSSIFWFFMKYKALLLDFYGTLVAEDDHIINDVLKTIAACSPVSSDVKQIGRSWRFQEMCNAAFGESFKTQRALELESLTCLLADYKVELDPHQISEGLFRYWQAPQIFDDAADFLQDNRLPVCIVSNIDTEDLIAACAHAGWNFQDIITSEICRSYKPRAKMFLSALEKLGCEPYEVLHVGDSLSSDIAGAQNLDIDVAWLNRKGRTLPADGPTPTFIAKDLRELTDILQKNYSSPA